MPTWQHRRDARNCRIEAGAKLASGKIVEVHNATVQTKSACEPRFSLLLPRLRQSG
jgi:hypothetical protein